MKAADNFFLSIKALAKVALLSRPRHKAPEPARRRLVIMGNGPSLATFTPSETMAADLMAVNFAMNDGRLRSYRPQNYVLADPVFFEDTQSPQVAELWENIGAASWPMTLFVPARQYRRTKALLGEKTSVRTATFNNVGIEGFRGLCHRLYAAGAAMPRPRNVLVPAIMCAIATGYTAIALLGAEHNWIRDIDVTADNEVVALQRHFYEDSEEEKRRIAHVYKGVPLHSIIGSLAVALKSYHSIEAFAKEKGVGIYNCTPGSFIDAFRRKDISQF